MRIVLTALGTVGDVLPITALAIELRRYGHQLIFALPLELLAYPRRHGFEAIQLGPDLSEINARDLRLRTQGKQEGIYYQALFEAAPQILEELRDLCETADLLISSASMRFGRIIHELSGIPFASIHYTFPRSYGGEGTKAYEQAIIDNKLIDIWKVRLNDLRMHLGLLPLSASDSHSRSPQLALYAMSRILLPQDHEWLKLYCPTGCFFIDESNWQSDPELAVFLQSGSAPVVISLGSMIDDSSRLSQIFLAAIEAIGCRAVIQSGWTSLVKDVRLPEMVYRADFVPHSWLFPKASCVIHHGGAGTTIAALRAGVPSIIIPHAFDQFAMAQRAKDLGCASGIFSLQELNVDQLSAAIVNALVKPNYRTISAKIGKQIEADQGVKTARVLIERFMEKASKKTRN